MTIDQFFKAKNHIIGLFRARGYSPQATDAIVLLLQMQIFYRKPVYPSYQWVADNSGCCAKTVARIVMRLRRAQEVKVTRLYYNGKRSVNRINLGKLISELRKSLGPALYRKTTWVQMSRTPQGILVKFCFSIKRKGGEYLPSWWQGELEGAHFSIGKTSTLWRRYPELVRPCLADWTFA